jgi:hypothetical protein
VRPRSAQPLPGSLRTAWTILAWTCWEGPAWTRSEFSVLHRLLSLVTCVVYLVYRACFTLNFTTPYAVGASVALYVTPGGENSNDWDRRENSRLAANRSPRY